jgi:hypothetical protein
MASNSRKRQTFAKLARERAVAEKRTRKQEKRQAAGAAAADATAVEETVRPVVDEEEVRRLSRLR